MNAKFVAVLSSPLGFAGMTLKFESVPFPTELAGIPHYVGHPATKALLEALGAVPAPTKIYGGPEVGQAYLAVPLAQNPRTEGYTADTAVSDVSQLKAVLVTRLA